MAAVTVGGATRNSKVSLFMLSESAVYFGVICSHLAKFQDVSKVACSLGQSDPGMKEKLMCLRDVVIWPVMI